jgi:hypothetical protein
MLGAAAPGMLNYPGMLPGQEVGVIFAVVDHLLIQALHHMSAGFDLTAGYNPQLVSAFSFSPVPASACPGCPACACAAACPLADVVVVFVHGRRFAVSP